MSPNSGARQAGLAYLQSTRPAGSDESVWVTITDDTFPHDDTDNYIFFDATTDIYIRVVCAEGNCSDEFTVAISR